MFVRYRVPTIRSISANALFVCVILGLLFPGRSAAFAQTASSDNPTEANHLQPADNNNSYTDQIKGIADRIPGNVNIFLCINDADATLRRLENTPVKEGIRAFYERSNGGLLWKHLADRIGLEPDDLFKMLVSRQLVFTARYQPRVTIPARAEGKTKKYKNTISETNEVPDDTAEKHLDNHAEETTTDKDSFDPHHQSKGEKTDSSWLVLAQTGESDFRRILTSSNADVSRWVGQTPVYGSERAESLDMAYSFGMTVLAPQSSGPLLDEIITNRFTESLADKPSFIRSMKNNTGSIVFFARHPQWKKQFTTRSVERWLGISVSISDDSIHIRALHHKTPEKPSRSTPLVDTENRIDLSPLDIIDNGALAVLIERFTDEPATSLGSSSISAPFVQKKPSILQFAGPTMFTIVSAKDPHTADTIENPEVFTQLQHIMRAGEQQLTITWGIELKGSTEAGSVMMNELFLESLNALKVCIDHPQRLNIPKTATRNPDKIQSVDLTPCAKHILNVLPGNDNLNLYWATVRAGDRSWWLCATDLDAFNETRRILRTLQPKRAASAQSATGIINGPAVASLLDSWQEVNDTTTHPLFSRLFYIEELFKGIPHIQWAVDDDENNITTTQISAEW